MSSKRKPSHLRATSVFGKVIESGTNIIGNAHQNSLKHRGRNNKNRGKVYERRVAAALGGIRNISNSQPHTDVETDDAVYEVKSTQTATPSWLLRAMSQLELASEESNKKQGGVVKVYTKGAKARAFLIKEIDLL